MQDGTGSPERWLPVAGYEDLYEVSDRGRVRSVDANVSNGVGTRLRRGRVLKQTPSKGRPTVKLSMLAVTRTKLVHQLVLIAFAGPRPEGMQVCHNNGICWDNRLENLRFDTPSENMQDKLRHGTNHNRNRVVCPRKHPLAAPNLVASRARAGHRVCMACARARSMEQRVREKSSTASFDFQAVSDAYYAEIMAAAA